MSKEMELMQLPKLSFSDIKRTNLTCPSAFEVEVEEGLLTMSFRRGELKIYLDNKLLLVTDKNSEDISSYLSDEDLFDILNRHGMLSEELK